MPNYKGNPNIKKHGFTTDRDASLTAQINLRVTPEMRKRIKGVPNYPEKLREVIQQWLDTLDVDDKPE